MTQLWQTLRRLVGRKVYVLDLQPGTTLTVTDGQIVRFRSASRITMGVVDIDEQEQRRITEARRKAVHSIALDNPRERSMVRNTIVIH